MQGAALKVPLFVLMPFKVAIKTPSHKRFAFQAPVAVPRKVKLIVEERGDVPDEGLAATETVRVGVVFMVKAHGLLQPLVLEQYESLQDRPRQE